MEEVLEYLEWEKFDEPIEIDKVQETEPLYEGNKNIIITRDEKYYLQTIFSTDNFVPYIKDQKSTPGKVIHTYDIIGWNTKRKIKYKLQYCNMKSYSLQGNLMDAPSFQINLHSPHIIAHYDTRSKMKKLIEWIINGPNDSFIYQNATERKIEQKYERTRTDIKKTKVSSLKKKGSERGSHRLDFLMVSMEDNMFIISKVPKTLGPIWSNNICIEYSTDWGTIPSDEEREINRELCSFILGRQLFLIGHSIYNRNNDLIGQLLCNPRNDSRRYTNLPDYPPIRNIPRSNEQSFDKILSHLLPQYQKKRDLLNLHTSLNLYWIARLMPIPSGLPILAASLENLINNWYKSMESKSQGCYISKKEYQAIVREDILRIKKKIDSIPYGPKILNKIQNAYQMGITDRFKSFFIEVGIPLSVKENSALVARHKVAHGSIQSQGDVQEMYLTIKTYETLLHKVLLKMLDYQGSYIDYSEIGFPDKRINSK